MKIRKALSFALCLVMLFSLVPMAAFATDGTSLQFRHGYWNDELERNEPSEERYSEMVKDYPHSGEYFFYLVDAQGRETPVNADELIFEGAVHGERYEGLAENEVRIWPETTGDFTVSYGEYSLKGKVVLPRSAFYTQPVADVEYFIDMHREGFTVTEENNVLYFVLTEGRVISKFYPEGELSQFVDYKVSDDGTYAKVSVKTLPDDMDSWGGHYYFRYSYTVDTIPDESGGGGSEYLSLINGFPHLMGHYTSWNEEGQGPSEETISSASIEYSVGELLYFSFGNKDDYELLGPDDVKVADSGIVELVWEGQEGACYLQTLGLGKTEILYTHTNGKTYSFPVEVNLPYIGCYNEPVRNGENLIDIYKYNGSEGSFYILPDENSKINSAVLMDDYYAWPEGSSVTVASDGSYAKVTLRGGMQDGGIQVPVVLNITDQWGDSNEFQYWCSIANAKPGMLMRYQLRGSDGSLYPDSDYAARDIYASLGWADMYICFFDGEKEVKLKASQLAIGNKDILVASDAADGALKLDFLHRGDTTLSYTHSDGKTYSLPVNVDYPVVGVYSEKERSEEALVLEYSMKQDGDNLLYVLADEGYAIVSIDNGDLPKGSYAYVTGEGAEIVIAPFIGGEKRFTVGVKISMPDSNESVDWEIYLPVTGLEESDCALGHTWDDVKITVQPSETEDGEKVYICSVCGKTKTEIIPAYEHFHQYTYKAVEPNCTDKGYGVYTCACGDSYTGDYIDPMAYNFQKELRELVGYGVWNYDVEYIVHKTNRSFFADQIFWDGEISETVSAKDYEDRVRSLFAVEDAVFAELHTIADRTDPSLVSNDRLVYNAEKNEYTLRMTGGFGGGSEKRLYRGFVADGDEYKVYYEEVTYSYMPGTLPDGTDSYDYLESLGWPDSVEIGGKLYVNRGGDWVCTEAYNDYGKVATVEFVGDVLRIISVEDFGKGELPKSFDDKNGDALGHDWDAGKVTKEPTENAEGEKTFTCTRCGETKVEKLPVKDHECEYKPGKITAPTCTEEGYTTYSCACGDSYVDDRTPALGHDWDAGKVTKEPTENAEGEKTFTCTRCEETRTEKIEKLDPKPPVPQDNPFTDVAEKDFFFAPVQWAVNLGVTNGLSATSFGPKAECTRAQVVTFLWRAAGKPAPKSSENPFTDVAEGVYYYDAVLWAVEEGITTGVSATEFGPGVACNRAQVVTFLWRAAGKPGPDSNANPFGDVAEGVYYYDAVLWAVENGITTGLSSTAFGPGSVCNRGQIVTFLYRHFED